MVDEGVLGKITTMLKSNTERDAFYAALAKARKMDLNVEFADAVLARLEDGQEPTSAITSAMSDCEVSY